MKKLTFSIITICSFLTAVAQTITVQPNPFAETDEITITVADFNPSTAWGVTDIYLWTWYMDLNNTGGGNSPTNGEWTNSDESQKFSNNTDGTYSYTFTPTTLYNDTDIGRIGFLIKADDGDNGKTSDHLFDVGVFQIQVTAPPQAVSVLDLGDVLTITATATVQANFELFENGATTPIHSQNETTAYTYAYPVTASANLELVVTEIGTTTKLSERFSIVVPPTVTEAAVPAGMKDGLNIDPTDPTTATFVLYAPEKKFVHLKGNFLENDWAIDDTFLLQKDSTQDRFWITVTNLPNDSDILYQYEIDATITIADPYATLILSEFNDGEITTTTFPNLPNYPTGKTNHAVSYFKTGEPAYEWQITDFQKPAITDLVIYELLIRDFDALHSFDAVKARLDYLETLGVNAIELMPVSEFDGNNSWGYNPSFHMALDKYYGTPTAFKELIDACHARGIAVILDVVYNHATGQNPYYRMWNDCNGCYTGKATSENPFFNTDSPNTNFSFFNDINHQTTATKTYIDRLNEYWLTEYHIDGFRFDFTKGFTNTIGTGEAFDQSRIDILIRMNTAIKNIANDAYVILEHLATNNEETDLIDAGMLVWSNLNFNYNQATMGYNDSNFQWISYKNRGWTTPSNIAYMESHDEERLMFKNLAFGNTTNAPTYTVKDLSTALDRIALAGAFYFTIPGPKMIWQFGELGYDFSINSCEDDTIDNGCRTNPKPIRWDYYNVPDRKEVYNLYATLIQLKRNENIFASDDFTLDVAATTSKTIHITDHTATENDIQHVTIIGNFGVTSIDIDPSFQKTGTWYDLLDTNGSSIEVTDVHAPITLAPGEFTIYANQQSQVILSTPDIRVKPTINIYPNPTNTSFSINEPAHKIWVYTSTGILVKQFEGNFESGIKYDLSSLSNGLYIVQIENKKGKTVTKLMINSTE